MNHQEFSEYTFAPNLAQRCVEYARRGMAAERALTDMKDRLGKVAKVFVPGVGETYRISVEFDAMAVRDMRHDPAEILAHHVTARIREAVWDIMRAGYL